jgi:hypothetical protein
MLPWIVIPLGLLTALLLAAPQLVILGLFLFIIPGLVLALVPTLFVYLLATSLLRRVLPIPHAVAGYAVALLLTFGLSAAAMQPLRIHARQTFDQAVLPDIAPPNKLKIEGDILVDWPAVAYRTQGVVNCDYLCTALLDTPGVTSVTRVTKDGSATFRKGPHHAGELVLPDDPQLILQKFDQLDDVRGHGRIDIGDQSGSELQADWALRIAQGDVLRRDLPIRPDEIDWTVRFETTRVPGQPHIERLEITDSRNNVVVRRSLVRHFVPAPLFHFGFEGGSAVDGFNGARFTLGGSGVSNCPRFHQFDAAVELLRTVDIPRPAPKPDRLKQVEETLHAVLDNPEATETELQIAPLWLTQFRYNADADQLDTILRILNDDRIPDPADFLREALRSRTDLTPLRTGLVRRFQTATRPKSRDWYATALVGLADGTFANPTADERAIWSQALAVNEAAPFLERMADLGPAAVPELLAILDESLPRPWHARWRTLAGIRAAFQRLGPDAAPAAARIRTLIEDSPHSLLNSYGDRVDWLVTLRLMGVDTRDLPLGIKDLPEDKLAAEVRRIEQQVQRYQKSRQPRPI